MIQSLSRRRTRYDQHIFARDAEFAQCFRESRIGGEIREVYVFLHSVISPDLSRRCSILSQLFRRKWAGHNHSGCETKRQMIRRLMLVIHQRHGLDSQRRGCGNLRVGVMTDCEIESAIARPLAQSRRSSDQVSGFGRQSATTVAAVSSSAVAFAHGDGDHRRHRPPPAPDRPRPSSRPHGRPRPGRRATTSSSRVAAR